jgi:hypothetical protein
VQLIYLSRPKILTNERRKWQMTEIKGGYPGYGLGAVGILFLVILLLFLFPGFGFGGYGY